MAVGAGGVPVSLVPVQLVAQRGGGRFEKAEALPAVALGCLASSKCGEIEVSKGVVAEVVSYRYSPYENIAHQLFVRVPQQGGWARYCAQMEETGWTWKGFDDALPGTSPGPAGRSEET